MNRAQKEETLGQLKTKILQAPFVAMVDYRGVTVEEINKVRREFEKNGLTYLVAKNMLVNLAIAGTEYEGMGELLKGMNGIVISGEDAISSAKTLKETLKDFKKKETFILKGGFFDGDVLDPGNVLKVASLPSKEELLTMLLRTVQEGPRQAIGVIQAPARDLVNLIKNYEHKLSEAGE